LQEKLLEKINKLKNTEQEEILNSLEQIVEMLSAQEIQVAPVLEIDEIKP